MGKAESSLQLAEALGKSTHGRRFILSNYAVLSLFITLLKFSALVIFFADLFPKGKTFLLDF